VVLDVGDRGKVVSAPAGAARLTALAQARGNTIDKLAKQTIATDTDLAGLILTPRGREGPDVILDISQPGQPPLRHWWDMTTHKRWRDHVKKYADDYGEGTHLPTGPEAEELP
jgi:hypothetical protein